MSAATASIADVSRTDVTNKDDSRYRNNSGQAQCAPMTLPVLGTQRIIQGNGTTVGTVISLQCPAKHKLVGSELKCVMDINSPHWVGETYCKPLSYEDFGFRVAVLASMVSAAIILFMSMAFITCCLVDCMREDKRKKQEREEDTWTWEEQPQHQEDNRSRYSHKGRNNNNNNNTPEKVLSLWDHENPAMFDNMQACRCHQQYSYGLDREYGPAPPLSTLPGYDYNQPLLHPNLEYAKMSGLPEFSDPPQSSSQTMNPGLQISAERPGFVRQYGGRESSLSGVSPSTNDESNTRNINPAKEFSIRIISV
ncbi:sushi domain-containing protein 3 [Notothenia coriiceps]|uniref:Sushi domain-containing protein 3 n=1 Tax=Notothenia coriiceps TaxID=8208 RepID=A0A6I9Q0A0_9TELE|nr:PREDICTED: sushi domain-containing protein 3-like [Notothenia coriiceps]